MVLISFKLFFNGFKHFYWFFNPGGVPRGSLIFTVERIYSVYSVHSVHSLHTVTPECIKVGVSAAQLSYGTH